MKASASITNTCCACAMPQINGAEANEIILLNSHDGTSGYQMLAGQFRFVCSNGLVCGDTVADVQPPQRRRGGPSHRRRFEVLRGFDRVRFRDAMRAITLDEGEAERLRPLALKYDDPNKPAPIKARF